MDSSATDLGIDPTAVHFQLSQLAIWKSWRSSMVPTLRDGNRRCFSIWLLWIWKVLIEVAPEALEGVLDAQTFTTVEAWNHSDLFCRNYILNALNDSLVYCAYKTAKPLRDLWTRNIKLRMPTQRNLLSDGSLIIWW